MHICNARYGWNHLLRGECTCFGRPRTEERRRGGERERGGVVQCTHVSTQHGLSTIACVLPAPCGPPRAPVLPLIRLRCN